VTKETLSLKARINLSIIITHISLLRDMSYIIFISKFHKVAEVNSAGVN